MIKYKCGENKEKEMEISLILPLEYRVAILKELLKELTEDKASSEECLSEASILDNLIIDLTNKEDDD